MAGAANLRFRSLGFQQHRHTDDGLHRHHRRHRKRLQDGFVPPHLVLAVGHSLAHGHAEAVPRGVAVRRVRDAVPVASLERLGHDQVGVGKVRAVVGRQRKPRLGAVQVQRRAHGAQADLDASLQRLPGVAQRVRVVAHHAVASLATCLHGGVGVRGRLCRRGVAWWGRLHVLMHPVQRRRQRQHLPKQQRGHGSPLGRRLWLGERVGVQHDDRVQSGAADDGECQRGLEGHAEDGEQLVVGVL